MAKLTTIENMTIDFCNQLHKCLDTFDLSYKDIRATSKMLVSLYEVDRDLDLLRELNKTHEVIDQRTGKSLGELYDNETIERVMMSANISVGFWIRACENHIGYLTRKLII